MNNTPALVLARALLATATVATLAPIPAHAQQSDAKKHGWLASEYVALPSVRFDFRGGYPTADGAKKLADQLAFNRAVEVYLSQMPAVSMFHVWKGVATAGSGTPNQFVIWETLMDAQTLLLTGNSETVYGFAAIDLKRDGPVVVEVPPKLLGGMTDMWQKEILGVGSTGIDKGEGGKLLLLPPDYTGTVPNGYISAKSSTYKVIFGVRGFQEEGETDRAVTLMKSAKIYPLKDADRPPQQTFLNGSHQRIDTIFSDTSEYFEDLAALVDSEPADIIDGRDRFYLASIGIEKGKPFRPSNETEKLLTDAVRFGSAAARQNAFASTDADRLPYPDRKWEWLFIGGSAEWNSEGYTNIDRRAAFAYNAIGMSPAMVMKVVGAGSQYYWTPRDSTGAYLEGNKNYKLTLPANVPAKTFWSVVVYDALSRSMLRTDQAFPSVSQFTNPEINANGSVDIYFGPKAPKGKEKNWIQTQPDRGWFPLLRFYGPLEPFFDKSWKPGDIEPVR